jgi:hypothetical protein
MSYRLGEPDQAGMAQVVMRMLMEGNSRIVCEKRLLIWSLVLFGFRGKILISLWFKTKKDIAVKSFKKAPLIDRRCRLEFNN